MASSSSSESERSIEVLTSNCSPRLGWVGHAKLVHAAGGENQQQREAKQGGVKKLEAASHGLAVGFLVQDAGFQSEDI